MLWLVAQAYLASMQKATSPEYTEVVFRVLAVPGVVPRGPSPTCHSCSLLPTTPQSNTHLLDKGRLWRTPWLEMNQTRVRS